MSAFFIPTIEHFCHFFVKCMIVMKVEYMVPIRAFQTTRTAQLEVEHIFFPLGMKNIGASPCNISTGMDTITFWT